jgi:hypothetical protein
MVRAPGEPYAGVMSRHPYAQVCIWCTNPYHLHRSPARGASMFCSQKCETEASYWLHALLMQVF